MAHMCGENYMGGFLSFKARPGSWRHSPRSPPRVKRLTARRISPSDATLPAVSSDPVLSRLAVSPRPFAHDVPPTSTSPDCPASPDSQASPDPPASPDSPASPAWLVAHGASPASPTSLGSQASPGFPCSPRVAPRDAPPSLCICDSDHDAPTWGVGVQSSGPGGYGTKESG